MDLNPTSSGEVPVLEELTPSTSYTAPLTESNVANVNALDESLSISTLSRNSSGGGGALSESASFVSGSMVSSPQSMVPPEVDPQILEALKSKDRLYVLKLGEIMESLIKEGRSRAEVNPSTSYQRLLVHRCSAYYKLTPESDQGSKVIFVHLNVDSRVPGRRLCELIPAESSTHPAFKIMRRTQQDRKNSRPQSHASSVAGDEQDLSDSETGSLSSRGHNASSKKHLTVEERRVAYDEARSRIFMDFEEKDKDISACSSTLSLVSGSGSNTSGGGGSSVCDFDESVGTSTTESEWSARESRRGGGGGSGAGSVASSSRSLRSSAPPFNASGSGSSSRDSRAASPAFTYASLYEPPTGSYDPSHHAGPQQNSGYMQPFYYPYPPPHGQVPYMHPPYPYYPYHYPQNHADPATPMTGDGYGTPPHPPHMVGVSPYFWPSAPGPQHSASQPPAQQPPPNQPPNTNHSTPVQTPPHMIPQGSYSVPSFLPYGYYYPAPPPMDDNASVPPPPLSAPPRHVYSEEHQHNPWSNGGGTGNHASNASRPDLGQSRRGGRRATNGAPHWSYGPGISGGGTYYNGNGVEPVGPRLTSGLRKQSGNSNASRSDEVSSNASSSTTSSSSRKTQTSTASSQHPLPARPDWAVGLTAHRTLHPSTSSRHHDSNTNSQHHHNQSPSGRKYTPNRAHQQPSSLQSTTDFPPLTQDAKRPPAVTQVAGAWTNLSSAARTTHPIMLPPGKDSHHGSSGNALHSHGVGSNGSNAHPLQQGSVRNGDGSGQSTEDHNGAYERPPPKGPAELFNPKAINTSRRNAPMEAAAMPKLTLVAETQVVDKEKEGVLLSEIQSLSLSQGTTIDRHEQQNSSADSVLNILPSTSVVAI